MVRIGNKEIPSNKNISIALTYIYGIGRSRAEQIVKKCDVEPNFKTKDLNEKQIKDVSQLVGEHVVEEKLKEQE